MSVQPSAAGPPGQAATGARRRLFGRRSLVGACVVALAVAGLIWRMRENFHTVLPGQVYRSAQLGPAALRDRINQFHLRSVLNLRGANPTEDWWGEECAEVEHAGILHYDLATDSEYPPTPADLRKTLEVLDRCERPMLIHCQSGIDRTGVVAAVCVLLENGSSTAQARGQFGLLYGALPWRASTARQQNFLGQYEGWLEQNGFRHTPDHFRHWALNVYQGFEVSP